MKSLEAEINGYPDVFVTEDDQIPNPKTDLKNIFGFEFKVVPYISGQKTAREVRIGYKRRGNIEMGGTIPFEEFIEMTKKVLEYYDKSKNKRVY